MRTWLEYVSTSVGYKAWEACICQSTARVIGVTARGLFLLAAPQRVVFVSVERYRSPLTINLDRSGDRFGAVEVGAAAQFSDYRLIFPSIETAITLSTRIVWKCPPPVATARPCAEQWQTLRAIAAGALARARSAGWAPVLAQLADMPDASPLSAEFAALLDRLLALRQAVQAGDSRQMLAGLAGLLGQGRGLTPSGDDVAIGLLLMLNRWHTGHAWRAVNRAVIDAAYHATTTISANLIECAADGQGDERLIAVADGIATGTTALAECVENVLSWGNSSGVDALTGMALAIGLVLLPGRDRYITQV